MSVNVENLIQEIKNQLAESPNTLQASCKPTTNRFYVDVLLSRAAVGKSFVDSRRYRSLGYKQWMEKKLYRALKLYTNSLALSTENSPDSDMAYSCRAAVFYSQKRFVSCLLDVNRVLADPYHHYYLPDELRKRLLYLRQRCLACIREPSGSFAVRIGDTDTDLTDIDDNNEEWSHVICKQFNNPLIPYTTSKIRLECNEQWGRHWVATEDIEPGEALSAEEFFLADVLCSDDLEQDNCSYCLKACDALIPCPSCAVPLYCSKLCRLGAYLAYHRIECRLRSFYVEQKIDMPGRLAIRALLVGTGQGAGLEHLMKRFTIESIFSEKIDPTARSFYFFNAYLTTLTLCRTFDESQLMSYVNQAVSAINKLKDVSFFNDVSETSLDSSKVFAAALLVNHIYTLRKNEFLLSYRIHEPRSMTKVIGQCFLHTFLNHSCNPNAFSIVRNRMHVLFAQRPIKKYEQIFITYCGSFADVPTAQRLEMLTSMWDFTCTCEACRKNWPTFAVLVNEDIKYVTGDGGALVRDLVEMITPFFRGHIQNLSNTEILRTVVNVIKLMYVRIEPPSPLITLSEIALKIFTDQLYGNVAEIRCIGEEDIINTLNDLENLVDVTSCHPSGKVGVVEIASILEKLFSIISKHFTANRWFYKH